MIQYWVWYRKTAGTRCWRNAAVLVSGALISICAVRMKLYSLMFDLERSGLCGFIPNPACYLWSTGLWKFCRTGGRGDPTRLHKISGCTPKIRLVEVGASLPLVCGGCRRHKHSNETSGIEVN